MYSTKQIKDFLNLSGSRRNEVVLESRLATLGYSEQKLQVLLQYFDLLKNSEILDSIPYDFYINKMSYKELEEKYFKSKIFISNSIARGTTKFFDVIGMDVFQEVSQENLSVSQLKSISNMLSELRIDYTNKVSEISDSLIIDLNEYFPLSVKNNPDLTEEDIVQITNKLKLLSKNYLKLVLDALNQEHLGYLKYLLETENRDLTTEEVLLKNIFVKRMM